jgi:hypothetical protein
LGGKHKSMLQPTIYQQQVVQICHFAEVPSTLSLWYLSVSTAKTRLWSAICWGAILVHRAAILSNDCRLAHQKASEFLQTVPNKEPCKEAEPMGDSELNV